MASKIPLKRAQEKPLDIVIIGGSLSGLIHGVMLKRLGHQVQILDQQVGSPKSQMSGIAFGPQVREFLGRFDRLDQPFAVPSEISQYIDSQARMKTFLVTPRSTTSWDAFFYRLRANFDSLQSSYYCEPPRTESSDGTAVYRSGKRVTDILPLGQKVVVMFDDFDIGESKSAEVDLVLGADGANSIVRRVFLPSSPGHRSDSGYALWRGTVPEQAVSEATRKCFHENITYMVLQGEHVLVYTIPGDNGSLKPGQRLLNFAWYKNHSPSELADIMTDRDGHEHNATVMIRDDVWETQCSRAKDLFTAPYREIMSKISRPYVQRIVDCDSSRAAFMDGKVLLVGDALSHFRPHIAYSTNQAAFDCLQMERYLKGEISLADWETKVLRFGHLHWLRSIWWGDYFQRGAFRSLPSACWYWREVVKQKLYWW